MQPKNAKDQFIHNSQDCGFLGSFFKIIFQIQISSAKHTYDFEETYTLEINPQINKLPLDFRIERNEKPIDSKNYSQINGHTIQEIISDSQLTLVVLAEEKEFSKKQIGPVFPPKEVKQARKESSKYLELVQKYLDNAWIRVDSTHQTDIRALLKRDSARTSEENRKKGLINYRAITDSPTPAEELHGGFSPPIFNQTIFQNYAKCGKPSGWMGASIRTKDLDAHIEETLSNLGSTPHEIATWATSTHGRHFANSLEDYDTLAEKKKAITESGTDIYNTAIVYTHPQHTGWLASSVKIRKNLREKNLLI